MKALLRWWLIFCLSILAGGIAVYFDVHKNLYNAKNKTSIIIAHRLETIKKTNKIIYLEHGRIIEKGTHIELMKKKSGKYRKLYNIQFRKKQNQINNLNPLK